MLQVEGVEGFFSAKDVPGHDVVPHSVPGSNQMGSVMHDEEVFARHEVKCVGQVSLSHSGLHVSSFTASIVSC